MSSTPFVALKLEVKPSKTLRAWINAVHGALFLVIVLAPASKLMVAVLLCLWISSLILCTRHALKTFTLHWEEPESWRVEIDGQVQEDLVLAQYARWGASAVSLRFDQSKLGWVMVFEDSVIANDHRLLRRQLFTEPTTHGIDL